MILIDLIILIFIIAVVALVVSTVIGFFSSGSRKTKKELRAMERQANVARTALIEIAAGDAMPVLRASDALKEMSNSYWKEISK